MGVLARSQFPGNPNLVLFGDGTFGPIPSATGNVIACPSPALNFIPKWINPMTNEICNSEIFEDNSGFLRIGDDGTGNIGLGAARLTINADPTNSKLAAINFSIQNGVRRFIFGFDGGNNISIRNLFTNYFPFIIDKNNDNVFFNTKAFTIQGDDPSNINLRLDNTNANGNNWTFRSVASSGIVTPGSLTIDADGNSNPDFRMVLTPNMDVGISTGAPVCKLDVNGIICSMGTPVSSDQRFKKEVAPLQNVLEQIKKMDGVYYIFNQEEFKNRNFPDGRHLGVIAQDLEKIFPELVKTFDHGFKAVYYDGLVPV